MIGFDTLPQLMTVIGGLGTAAFGVIDATKAFGGGVNHIGFQWIAKAVLELTPGEPAYILRTLQANWFSGTDLARQKSIAKSLVAVNLKPDLARMEAAEKELMLTARLDEAYERADQSYRNGTKAWAMAVAILLALSGGHAVHAPLSGSLLIGILATPLAPVAKDLSSALETLLKNSS